MRLLKIPFVIFIYYATKVVVKKYFPASNCPFIDFTGSFDLTTSSSSRDYNISINGETLMNFLKLHLVFPERQEMCLTIRLHSILTPDISGAFSCPFCE